jgi:uncharacterized protein (DUF2336 family)
MMDVLAAFAVFKAYRAAADNAADALVILQAHAKNADITDIQLARVLELPQQQLIWLKSRRKNTSHG